MDFLSSLSSEQLALLDELKQKLSSFTNKAYVVGGALRDAYMGIKPKDLDVEIYGISPQKFERFTKDIGALGVGKSFFVYKWKDLDISLPRSESKISSSHQGFEVRYCDDEKKASSRRDFTMNTLMFDIFSNKLLDFWGGVQDIKTKTIRLIDEEKFAEDSLRILRGVRFSSQFAFDIDKKTLKVMQKMPLDEISSQRIFWELEKIFVSKNPEIGFINLVKIGFFQKMFSLQIDEKKAQKIALRLKEFLTCKNENIHKYIFLHVVLNELNLPIKQSLKKLHVSCDYMKFLQKSPYKLAPLSDKELFVLSLDLQLKNWLGIGQKSLAKRAKELGIYENKFDKIKVSDVIKDGFKGGDISKELRRRQLECIEKICEK